MKVLIILLGLLAVGCVQDSKDKLICVLPPEYDQKLDTREKILDYLTQDSPNANRDNICVDSCSKLKDLFIVGYFADDAGCMGMDLFFKGEEVKLTAKLTREILFHSGFNEDMNAITQAYHKEMINHHEMVLSTKPERFDEGRKNFFKPTVKLIDDEIISEMWILERVGMLPEVSYHISTLTISTKGEIVSHSTKERFTVRF